MSWSATASWTRSRSPAEHISRSGAASTARCRRAGGVLWLALAAAGCASTPPGEPAATGAPTFAARLHQAFTRAAAQPTTWVPLTGALLIYAADRDQAISDWAREHTPVFGSSDDAARASDRWRDALVDTAVLSALLKPGPVATKATALLVDAGALQLTSAATGALKDASGRTRPNAANDRSFPSGHSSRAAAAATLAARDLEPQPLPPALASGARVLLAGAAATTAWARVEAGVHYPSDVLAGAALGNFVAALVHDAFSGPRTPALGVAYDAGGATWLVLRFDY